jgi:hypothetical protein
MADSWSPAMSIQAPQMRTGGVLGDVESVVGRLAGGVVACRALEGVALARRQTQTLVSLVWEMM